MTEKATPPQPTSAPGGSRLAAVTMVKNECDIIELFVRINSRVFDFIHILDHGSNDGTADILARLTAEGYALSVTPVTDLGFTQTETTTQAVLDIARRNAFDYLHFHCVVIDGVFESAPADGVVFHAATGLEANAIAQVQAQVRRRLLRGFVRRGLLPSDDARAMAQWDHGGGFSVDGSVRIEAADRAGRERLLRYDRRKSPFGIAPDHRSPWTGCANSVPNACAMRSPSPVRAGPARCFSPPWS